MRPAVMCRPISGHAIIAARALVFGAALLSLAGCSHMSRQQQRALSGGAIGAAGGAAITAIAGGPILLGTAVGAAGGAVIGAVTH